MDSGSLRPAEPDAHGNRLAVLWLGIGLYGSDVHSQTAAAGITDPPPLAPHLLGVSGIAGAAAVVLGSRTTTPEDRASR